MFKVFDKNGKTVVQPDWKTNEARRIVFKGFKCSDEDSQYFYVALFQSKVNVAKKWSPYKDKQGGEYVEVTEFTEPTYLRFQKIPITYKGKEGKPDTTYNPTQHDELFIKEWKELALKYPDGKVSGTLDFGEMSCGAVARCQVETDEAKKTFLRGMFFEVKVTEEEITGLDEFTFKELENKGSSGKNYTPKETMAEVLQARLQFVKLLLAETIGEEGGENLPLITLVIALRKLELGEASLSDFKEIVALILGDKVQ